MHILLSVNSSWNVMNFRKGLVQALLADGHRITVLAPRDAYSEQVMALGCDFVDLKMDKKGTSPLRDALLVGRYMAVLRRLRPDVYLGFTIKPNIYGSLAARLFGVPAINNITGLGTVFLSTGLVMRLVVILYKLSLRSAHLVFFQNPDDRAQFRQLNILPDTPTALLPGSGVNLSTFAPMPQAQDRVGKAPVFLLVARLLRTKGIVEYAEAARKVRKTRPEVEFRLLGFLNAENPSAISEDEVQGWTDDGVLTYLGEADDVRPHIADADCIVLPSYTEGTPRSLIEAAAMGRPLIATDVPGCRGVIKEGENGFLCLPQDVEGLAEAMSRFCGLDTGQRNAMGKASRQLAEHRFDEALVIQAYRNALSGLNR